jgi:hypothetical protein
MLADGRSVWVAWAGISTSERVAVTELYQADVVSGADRLVRRREDGRLRVLCFEKVFEKEAEAKSHIAATLDSYVSAIQTIASRYR